MSEKIEKLVINGEEFSIEGKSAYEVACDNGYEGDELEWLESLKGEQGDQGEKGEGAETYGTLRGLPTHNGYIRSAGTWGVATGYEHIVIPVEGGQNISIVGNETQAIYLAFLTDYADAVDQVALPFSADVSFNKRIDLGIGKSANYTAPEDAKYLYVQTLFTGAETYPTSLVIDNYEYCQGLDYLEKGC